MKRIGIVLALLLLTPINFVNGAEILVKLPITEGEYYNIPFGAGYINITATKFYLSEVWGWYAPVVVKYPGEPPIYINVSELGYYDKSHGIMYLLSNVTDLSNCTYVKIGKDEKYMGIEVIGMDLTMGRVRFFAPNGKVISLGIGEAYEVFEPEHMKITLKDFVKVNSETKALFEIEEFNITADFVVLKVESLRKMDVVFIVGSKAASLDFEVAEDGASTLKSFYNLFPTLTINVDVMKDVEIKNTSNKIVLSVGGPAVNNYTKEINEKLLVSFEKEDGKWRLKSGDKTWDGDYGIIGILPRWENGTLVKIDIVIAGITRKTTKSAYEHFKEEVMNALFDGKAETPVGIMLKRLLSGDYGAVTTSIAVVVNLNGEVVDVIIGGPGGI
ncbi:hypothetical protein E3E31_06195 [Thermococcus sp. M39]|uniref:hypothetical protein n=1 Tax=unclassified Thermococcus TaxID=2627626 RepID=UPI00143A1F06|nr:MULTISPECIES: hypothetical protein [unclassified Thermococcus]NJE08113.1 hypothetical protein [Thermococcus sp. M39]NJE11606.1 hypothetical protein [Thermococcus sp. LS2]